MEPDLFDKWRRDYDGMTVEDHSLFYNALHYDHPNQRYFDTVSALQFFTDIPGNIRVVELGGYDGGLARACLDGNERIKSWVNYDLDPKGELVGDRYVAFAIKAQLWEITKSVMATAFVSSHTIEHLSISHVLRLLECVRDVPNLFLDVPLAPDSIETWDGKTCAHKLEMSWNDLEKIVCGFGYTAKTMTPSARSFTRAE